MWDAQLGRPAVQNNLLQQSLLLRRCIPFVAGNSLQRRLRATLARTRSALRERCRAHKVLQRALRCESTRELNRCIADKLRYSDHLSMRPLGGRFCKLRLGKLGSANCFKQARHPSQHLAQRTVPQASKSDCCRSSPVLFDSWDGSLRSLAKSNSEWLCCLCAAAAAAANQKIYSGELAYSAPMVI